MPTIWQYKPNDNIKFTNAPTTLGYHKNPPKISPNYAVTRYSRQVTIKFCYFKAVRHFKKLMAQFQYYEHAILKLNLKSWADIT